jgi:ATP-binding cassette subfamily F protein uup
VIPFATLAQWEAWRAANPPLSPSSASASASTAAPAAPPRRRLGYLEQREYQAIEQTIADAEATLQRRIAESEEPKNASDAARLVDLLATIAGQRAEIDRLYTRWAELQAKLEGGDD